ncbi:pyridoxal-phosphate-dependent aminotransferase family protein [Tepidibacter mesophilus]|uniref:pyridoxal-phosphate-dependent aminotransferase family protein n=1 Tax=Tepidibacter mesophilus TaxID=655607 RepID=UPI001FA86B10|nr:alanine--glyoxylate aminotransferase family protein [Tepidibacter mesophilus]
MKVDKILMTPGPTNVPKRVLNKMAESMIHHRTDEFANIFKEFNERLKYVFQTDNTVLTFPSSGTGGLEASIVNMFSKKDKVLIVSIGVFGDRFADIARIYDIEVDKLDIPWGKGVEIEDIQSRLTDQHKALIVTHNETSTGANNNIQEIGKFMKNKKQLYIVDAVSSLGAIEIKMDDWNIDILVSGSQKALMSPPGLSFIAVSEKGWKFNQKSNIPKYYFDFKKAKDSIDKELPQTPYTPAVTLIIGANEALKMIQEEGIDNACKRHERLAYVFRNGVKNMGLEFFVDEKYQSNTVTSIKMKNKAVNVKTIMEKEFNIVIAAGQGKLKNEIIRIGHMGCVDEKMINKTLHALNQTLKNF